MLVTKEELDQYMESDKFEIFHEHKQQKDDNHYILTVADPTQAMQGNKEQANEQQATPQIDSQARTEVVKPAAQSTEQPASQQTTPQIDSQAQTEVVNPAVQSTEQPASQQATPTSQEPQNTLLAPHKPLKPQDNQDGEYLNATLDGSGTLHINNDPQKNTTVVTTRSRSAKVTSAKPKDTIENGASFTAPAAQDDMPIDYEKHMQEAEVASALRENVSHDFNKMQRNAKSKNAMTKEKTIAQPAVKPLTPTEANQAQPTQPLSPSATDMPNEKTENDQSVADTQPEASTIRETAASPAEALQHAQSESSQSSQAEPEPEKIAEFSIDDLERNSKIAKAMLGACKESSLIRAEVSKLTIKPLEFRYLKNGAKYELNFKDENTIRNIRYMIIGGDGSINIGFSGGEAISAYPLTNGLTSEDLLKQDVQWSYKPINIQKMVTELLPFCADISKVNVFGVTFAQMTFKTIILKKMS